MVWNKKIKFTAAGKKEVGIKPVLAKAAACDGVRQIWVAAVAAVIFSAAAIKFALPLLDLWYHNQLLSEAGRARTALVMETGDLAAQTKQIIASVNFAQYISERNIVNLISALDGVKKKYGIDYALATDASGIVLTRLRNVAIRGDNYFQTTAVGRLLSGGQEAAVIEKSRLLPLAIFSSKLIQDGGATIGSFITARLLDDGYAVDFKRKYLDAESEIIFYNAQDEVMGSSITDPQTGQFLSLLLNDGLANSGGGFEVPQKHIEFGGRYWVVRGITFPGLEESPGGALVIVRVAHTKLALVFAGIAALIFLLVEIILCAVVLPMRAGSRKKHYWILAGWLAAVFVAVFLAAGYVLYKKAVKIKIPPYTIYNSTLALEPEADVVAKDFDSRIAIRLRTGGEAVNAVEANLEYDPLMVRVAEIITTNSFCDPSMFLEKTIDNRNGRVTVACGLPSPGFNKPQGTVAELVLRPLKDGYFYLHFGDGTKVLANDGLGTDVLRIAHGGGYLAAGSASSTTEESFVVFSYTHPNSEKWYKRKNVYFSWPPLDSFRYRYAFNRDADYELGGDDPATDKSRLVFDAQEDGVYYLRLRPEKDGKILPETTYRVKVDFTPPQDFEVRASSNEAAAGDTVRFDFSTRDETSGLQNAYYVQIDGGVFLPVQPPLYAPFTEKGLHTVVVRAFDKAGNYREAEARVRVK